MFLRDYPHQHALTVEQARNWEHGPLKTIGPKDRPGLQRIYEVENAGPGSAIVSVDLSRSEADPDWLTRDELINQGGIELLYTFTGAGGTPPKRDGKQILLRNNTPAVLVENLSQSQGKDHTYVHHNYGPPNTDSRFVYFNEARAGGILETWVWISAYHYTYDQTLDLINSFVKL